MFSSLHRFGSRSKEKWNNLYKVTQRKMAEKRLIEAGSVYTVCVHSPAGWAGAGHVTTVPQRSPWEACADSGQGHRAEELDTHKMRLRCCQRFTLKWWANKLVARRDKTGWRQKSGRTPSAGRRGSRAANCARSVCTRRAAPSVTGGVGQSSAPGHSL